MIWTTGGQLRAVPVLFVGGDAPVSLLSHCAACPVAKDYSTELERMYV